MEFGFQIRGCLGSYEVLGRLGKGGFGSVFRACGPNGVARAVKYLNEDLDQDAVVRFEREMKIIAAIDHPNVIDLVDYGIDAEGRAWYAMPEMAGGTLADVIGRDRTWEELLVLVEGAALGLAELHGRGGIHRDVKPENILLDALGVPKLADFGVARCPEITGSSMTRGANGTAYYMAQEVWQGRACKHSDIYALGIVLWELVNGQRHTVPAKPPRLLKVGPEFKQMEKLYQAMTHIETRMRPSATEVAKFCQDFRAQLDRAPVPAETTTNWVPWVLGGLGLLAAGGLAVALLSED